MPAFLGYFDGVFFTFLNTNILWFSSKSGSLTSIFSINSIPKTSIAALDSSNSKLAFGPFKHMKYPPTFTNGTQNSINIGNPATALAVATSNFSLYSSLLPKSSALPCINSIPCKSN